MSKRRLRGDTVYAWIALSNLTNRAWLTWKSTDPLFIPQLQTWSPSSCGDGEEFFFFPFFPFFFFLFLSELMKMLFCISIASPQSSPYGMQFPSIYFVFCIHSMKICRWILNMVMSLARCQIDLFRMCVCVFTICLCKFRKKIK